LHQQVFKIYVIFIIDYFIKLFMMTTNNIKFSPKTNDRTSLTNEQFTTKVNLEKDNIKYYLSKLFKNNEAEMESLATLALQRAITNYQKYDGHDTLDTWLYGQITTAVIDHIKAKRSIELA